MASIGARLTVINEGTYGVPEQDANTALMELDRALRSPKLGEQCEAAVKVPKLIGKYPFPILINSAFIKLADAYKVGTNFLRICILRTAQQSQKHIGKILNVDEFLKRIVFVVYSNDPVSRAISLRMFGSIACSISEKKSIQNIICNGLESHDLVEVEAAIFAAEKFSSQSPTFAANICSRIGSMLENLATPVELKLKLVPIFQFMNHDADTAANARKLCVELMTNNPAIEVVCATVDTLTSLTISSSIYFSDQMELLLDSLQNDLRRVGKINSLNNLKRLASHCSHQFTTSHIKVICEFGLTTPYDDIKDLSFDVLICLSKQVAVVKFDISEDGSTCLRLIEENSFHPDSLIATKATTLLTHLAIHEAESEGNGDDCVLVNQAVMAIETLLLVLTDDDCANGARTRKYLQVCLQCAVDLSNAKFDVAHLFVSSISSLLERTTCENRVLLAEALAAMSSFHSGILKLLVPSILTIIRKNSESGYQTEQESATTSALCTLVFQATQGSTMDHSTDQTLASTFESVHPWHLYRVARQASRYGHHQSAALLYSLLTEKVYTEQFHFWLKALNHCASAECILSMKTDDVIEKLNQSTSRYMQASSALKAASHPSSLQHFQNEFIRLRADYLSAQAQLNCACGTFILAPPGAIAKLAASTQSRDDTQGAGRILTQLRKSAKEFKSLGEQYGKLYQGLFDADHVTLTMIQLIQQSCFLMVQAVEMIALKSRFAMGEDALLDLYSKAYLQRTPIELQGLVQCNRTVSNWINSASRELKPKLNENRITVLKNISRLYVDDPLCYPRYFFQALQSTSIKLAITPQPRLAGELIQVQSSAQLAVKVEGIIQRAGRSIRNIKHIQLSVSSSLVQKAPNFADSSTKNAPSEGSSFTLVLEPSNDFFQTQFLQGFPIPGTHLVTIDVAVIDTTAEVWKTGPKYTLSIKSLDDGSGKTGSGRIGSIPGTSMHGSSGSSLLMKTLSS